MCIRDSYWSAQSTFKNTQIAKGVYRGETKHDLKGHDSINFMKGVILRLKMAAFKIKICLLYTSELHFLIFNTVLF